MPQKRKDAALKGVVISERFDKKAAKFHAASVPFEYQGARDVYEASLRQPLGRDFNTDKSFRDLTRPTILKDAGVIIDPLQMARGKKQREDRGAGVKSGEGLASSGAKRKRAVNKPLGVKKVKAQ